MPNKNKQGLPSNITYKGLGIAIGLVFGGILGLITGDMIIFPGGGLVLGFAIGAAMDNRKKNNNS
jgi:hypothetical protein